MPQLSPDALKSRPWHKFQAEGGRVAGVRGWLKAEYLVPVAVVGLLLVERAFIMAAAVAGTALIVWLVRGFSPAGRRWIDKALGGLAHWVGQIVAVILLAPAFFIVMTLVRVMSRWTGADPLLLRSGEAPTFWLPSDLEARRARYVRSMFCTERLMSGRLSVLPLAVLLVVLLVAAEAGLRLYGLGTPMVYVQDQEVGYYPKPNQRVRYPHRVIAINNVSMRSPDIAPHKAPGHIRILMLGDSTLAGTYVSNGELYSSLLEKKLNAAAGAPIFEVMNMGVNAWGPFHELAYVKKFGTFEADVAVICGPIFDCYRPLYGLERLPMNPATHPPHLALEQVLYELVWRFRERCLGPSFWEAGERVETQFQLGADAYGDLARHLRQQGAEVVVEMLPPNAQAMGLASDLTTAHKFAEMTRRLEPLGVPLGTGCGVFQGQKSVSAIYHDGVHFTKLGHRLYADYLFTHLAQTSPRIKKAIQPQMNTDAHR